MATSRTRQPAGPAGTAAAEFQRALDSLREAVLRPEVRLAEIPAPARIAPHSVALEADVHDDHGDEVGSGKFILLHDPAGPPSWSGTWRVITFARAAVEPDLAGDAMLGAVGWTWLMERLVEANLDYVAEGGTVTRMISEGFAGLADRETTVDLEVRASWTPITDDYGAHLQAWCEALCTIAGMPPVPDGVVALPGRFR